MEFCSRCLYPDTRPDTHFLNGLCSGCRSFDERLTVDWPSRLAALRALLPDEVIVPVSGGKDSTFQILKMQEFGRKVLAVNATTDFLSDIGKHNLLNCARLSDRYLQLGVMPSVRKKLVRLGLFRVGDMSWPEHLSIWSIPTRAACDFGVSMIVWGEQPQREYACPEGVEPATRLDADWVAEFGGMLGMRLDDLIGEEGITEDDIAPLRFPDLTRRNVSAIWLGDYIPWDGWKNAFISQQYGFRTLGHPVETSLADYENLDNHVTVLRDWLRFLKYGYSRATDIANNHIRRGRLTREEAIPLVERAERFPRSSLELPIGQVLAYFDLTVKQFVDECDKWTNPEIFRFEGGKPVKESDGSPCRYPHASYRRS